MKLRSILSVPVMALSATLTLKGRKVLTKRLALSKAIVHSESPDRPNIRLMFEETKDTGSISRNQRCFGA